MKLRHLVASDASQIYDTFRSVAVMEAQGRKRDYGFYEYPLEEQDIKSRLELARHKNLGVGLFSDERKLLAYTLAYPSSLGAGLEDDVLRNVSLSSEHIYFDQLFMRPSLPAFFVGRLADYWTKLAQDQNFSGVFCAIPQEPWKNVSSTRFAIHRGFNRRGFVSSNNVNLGIFTKPLWEIGEVAKDIDIEIAKPGATA
ncbi:MAG: hypothetical protein Q7R87_03145 [Nanoarchaeota archaeon]|nr:hypothetical protein [Nanoarchaeota archaeon]